MKYANLWKTQLTNRGNKRSAVLQNTFRGLGKIYASKASKSKQLWWETYGLLGRMICLEVMYRQTNQPQFYSNMKHVWDRQKTAGSSGDEPYSDCTA